jgi:hypothetical protein
MILLGQNAPGPARFVNMVLLGQNAPGPTYLQDLLDRRNLARLERARRVVVEDDEPVVEAVDALLICAAVSGVKAFAASMRSGTPCSTAGAPAGQRCAKAGAPRRMRRTHEAVVRGEQVILLARPVHQRACMGSIQ